MNRIEGLHVPSRRSRPNTRSRGLSSPETKRLASLGQTRTPFLRDILLSPKYVSAMVEEGRSIPEVCVEVDERKERGDEDVLSSTCLALVNMVLCCFSGCPRV